MGILSFLWSNRATSQQEDHNTLTTTFSNFLASYEVDEIQPKNEAVITEYETMVPESLVSLWKTHGFSSYNNGMFALVNPDAYNDVLWTWLGKEMPNYVPFAITGFGDLFYYRKLTATDEDICVLQTHLRDISVCTWSLDDFFNEYLCEKEIRSVLLRSVLFEKARTTYGPLGVDEIFYFAPALRIGGEETITHVQKGNAQTHLSLLFELGK